MGLTRKNQLDIEYKDFLLKNINIADENMPED